MIGFERMQKCMAMRTAALVVMLLAASGAARAESNVLQATLAEPNQKTAEVSTEELRRILADGSAIVLDSRKSAEYAADHIAGARRAAPEAGAPTSAYVTTVERLVGGNKAAPLVLYCNGQFCQASRRLSEHLVAAGFTNVRRYQLGIPMWRTLGGLVEIEIEGIIRIFGIDRTAVYFDARSPEEFAKGSLAGALNLPPAKLIAEGPEKQPLPREDFNTRVILFGRDAAQARELAVAVGKTPYQNVSYFPGSFDQLMTALKGK